MDTREVADSASHAKSAFLAVTSHEIRAPMNAIIGLNYLLRETSLDEDPMELAGTVGTAAQGLLSLLNDILDISKIEAGPLEQELPHPRAFERQFVLEPRRALGPSGVCGGVVPRAIGWAAARTR